MRTEQVLPIGDSNATYVLSQAADHVPDEDTAYSQARLFPRAAFHVREFALRKREDESTHLRLLSSRRWAVQSAMGSVCGTGFREPHQLHAVQGSYLTLKGATVTVPNRGRKVLR
jgi:hypothetical protein